MAEAHLICGVDEAGRGPLAGPVYAAAVVFHPGRRGPTGIADSKVLGARERERLAGAIRKTALAWAVAWAGVEEIDRLNILQASLLAMRRAVEELAVVPDQVLVDGLHCPVLAIPARGVVRGDATLASISAASIIAKVARDAEMRALHRMHPHYGFDRHKGYPTVAHLAALRAYGACAALNIAPVRPVSPSGPCGPLGPAAPLVRCA